MNRILLTVVAFFSSQINKLKERVLPSFLQVDYRVWSQYRSVGCESALNGKLKCLLIVLFLTLGSFNQLFAQATFTSKANANWDVSSTWTLSSGSDGDGIPDGNDNVILANKFNVALTKAESCASLTINGAAGANKAQITINTFTLNVAGNITVSGGLNSNIVMTSGSLNIGGNFDSGATFAMGTGTVNYNNSGAQTVGAYTYNNLTVSGSGTKTASGNITVNKDFTLTGGTFALNNATSNSLTILGNYNQTAGVFDFNAGTSGASNMNLAGNFSNTTGVVNSMITSGNNAPNGIITFSRTGIQTLNIPLAGSVTWVKYIVNSSSEVKLTSDITLSSADPATQAAYTGDFIVNGIVDFDVYKISQSGGVSGSGVFTLNAGATLKTKNVNGVDGSVSSTNITRTFNTGANYIFNGTAAQITSVGMPATVNNLTVTNALGVTLSAATTVTNNFSIGSGAVANLGTFTHNANTLTLGNFVTSSGSWGSTSSSATNQNNTFFAATSGIVGITTTTCTTGNWTGVTSTDWNTASNWCGGIPTATTDVVIPTGTPFSPSIATGTTALCRNLTINASATLTLANSATSLLNISGNFANSGTLTAGAASTISFVGTANQSIGGFTTLGNVSMLKTLGTATFTGAVNGAALTINGTGGTLNLGAALTHTFTGDITLTAGALNGGSSTLNANATTATAWNGTGTIFTAATGTVIFGGVNQTIATATTFNNLTLSGSGAKTLSAAITAANLAVNTGVTATNNNVLTVSTALSGLGALTNASPGTTTLTISGTSSIATLTNAGTTNINGAGAISTAAANFVNTGTLNLGGSGAITGITNSTGGTIHLASSGNIGTLDNATATSVLNINAITVPAITTLTATTAGNTVNYNGAGAQTVKGTVYSNLNFSTSGTKTLGAATTTTGALTLNNNTNLAMSTFLLTLNGNLINSGSGTISGTTGGVTISGTAAQSIAGFTSAGTVTVSNTAGAVTFGSAIATTGNLTIATAAVANLGTFTHNANTLTLGGSTTSAGTWGSTTSPATNQNNTFFAATTGIVTVTTASCTAGNWIGLTSTDWNTPANWCGGIPTATTDVVIPTGTPFSPTIAAGTTALCRNLRINASATLTLANSATSLLNISGNFASSGTFTAGAASTISFIGTNQNVAGVTYSNLTLSGSGTKTFSANTIITNNLIVASGSVVKLNGITTHTAGTLVLGGVGPLLSSWGASASGATNTNNTYFTGSGRITVNGTPPYPAIDSNYASYTNGNFGTVADSYGENVGPPVFTAPNGTIFINVKFASYGTPSGLPAPFTLGTCDAFNSRTIATAFLGNTTASIGATNGNFDDPCYGTYKKLSIQATYTEPICSGSNPGIITGSTPTGGNGSYAYLWEVSTTSSTTGYSPASGTNNVKDYTPGNVSVTTWYRRTVTSGIYSSATIVIVQVNTNPTVPSTISGTTAICAGNSTILSVSGGSLGGPGGYAQWYNDSCGGTLVGTGNSITVSPTSTTTYYVRYKSGCNVTSCISATVTASTSITSAATATAVCANATSQTTPLTYSATTGTPTTYSIVWNAAPSNSFAAVTNASLPASPIQITVPAGTAAGTYTGTLTVKNGTCTSFGNTFTVTVNAKPTVTFTAQPGATACVNTDVTYTTEASQSNYVWTVPGVLNMDYSITSGGIGSASNTVTLQWLTGGNKIVTVNYSNAGGCTATTATSSTTTNIAVAPTLSDVEIACTATSFQLGAFTAAPGVTDYRIDVSKDSGFSVGSLIVNDSSLGTASPGTTPVNGLNKGGSYYVRVRAVTSCGIITSNVVNVSVKKTFYNGSSWSPLPPSANLRAVFTGNTTLTTQIDACSCQIDSGVKVFVGSPVGSPGYIADKNANAILKLENGLDVVGSGTLTFENNASLIQTNNANGINSGSIIYKRNAQAMNNFDYTYWSSPVAGQTLQNLSPNTIIDKYFSFGSNNWVYENYNAVMTPPGKGYIIRVPKPGIYSLPVGNPETVTMPYAQPVEFVGTPNNGSYGLTIDPAGSYNLIGNPYPSAMSADTFLSTNTAELEGTIYFWTHNTVVSNTGYNTSDYASYNTLGGVGTKGTGNFVDANNNGTLDPGEEQITNRPLGNIAAGQSFFTQSKAGGSGSVVFNNNMRVGASDSNKQFFKGTKSKTATSEKHRVWLNMTNTEGAFKQTLVGYVTGATSGYDSAFDGDSFDGNPYIDFYSVNEDRNLVIQGRPVPFDTNDKVPMGYKTTIDGTFAISIDQVDGVLASQDVYIEDKVTHDIHNLKKGSYSFTTAKGTFNDRFVLRYTDNAVVVVPPVVVQPPVVIEPPVVTVPPVIVEPPVVIEPPVVVQPPVVIEPPVVVQPPVVVEPPVAIEPPVVVQPPVVVSPPVVIPPIVSLDPTLENPSFTKTEKPLVVSVKNHQIKINSFNETMTAVMVYDLKGSLLYENDHVNSNEFIIQHLNSGDQFLIVITQLTNGKWISKEIIF
jgi:hypothetical protein